MLNRKLKCNNNLLDRLGMLYVEQGMVIDVPFPKIYMQCKFLNRLKSVNLVF